MKFFALPAALVAILCAAPTIALADPAARHACKQFIERSGYKAQDWGSYWNWTVVVNKDGTFSVGARFMGAAPGGVVRNLYVACVMARNGDNWKLEELTRLQ